MAHLIAFIVCLFGAVHMTFMCVVKGIRGDEAVDISVILIMDTFVTAAITLGITL